MISFESQSSSAAVLQQLRHHQYAESLTYSMIHAHLTVRLVHLSVWRFCQCAKFRFHEYSLVENLIAVKMAKSSSEVQQIDLTKLNLQQLQQLKNEFESVSGFGAFSGWTQSLPHTFTSHIRTIKYLLAEKWRMHFFFTGIECVSRITADTENRQNEIRWIKRCTGTNQRRLARQRDLGAAYGQHVREGCHQ